MPLLAYAVVGPSRVMVLGPDSSLADEVGEDRFYPTVGTAVDGYLRATGVAWVDWEERPDGGREG